MFINLITYFSSYKARYKERIQYFKIIICTCNYALNRLVFNYKYMLGYRNYGHTA